VVRPLAGSTALLRRRARELYQGLLRTHVLSAWYGLRRGECLTLRRSGFDPLPETLRVERSVNQLIDGALVVGPPKTEAGRHSAAIPPHIIPDLMDHLDRFVER
jgi:hypothetical protein